MKRIIITAFGIFLFAGLVIAAGNTFGIVASDNGECISNACIGAGQTQISGTLTPTGNYATYDPYRAYALGEDGAEISGKVSSVLWGDFGFSGTFKNVGPSPDCGTTADSKTIKLQSTSAITANSAFWGNFDLQADSYFCPFTNVDSGAGGKLFVHLNSTNIGEVTFTSTSGNGLTPTKVGGLTFNGVGLLSTKNSAGAYNGTTDENVQYLQTTITKYDAKTIINKNLESITRGLTPEVNLPPDLSSNSDKIFYFTKDVPNLSGVIRGKKTLIVEGGDVTISGNMSYFDSNSFLVLVVKKGNGKYGNINVKTSVTNVVGTLIADGSLMTEDSPKQLLIYGSLFTANTIGGSIDGKAECPYGTPDYNSCDAIKATKYDLARFRKFTVVPETILKNTDICYGTSDSNMVPVSPGTTTSLADAWAGGGKCAGKIGHDTSLRSTSKLNPLVIEYNPLIMSANMPILRAQ